MTTKIPAFTNIDEYIALWSKPVQSKLKAIRKLVKQTVPNAEESISYQLPTFKENGGLILHFAAFQKHFSLFPGPEAIEVLAKELSGYKTSKGTIQIPLEEDVPTELILKIIEFRQMKNKEKSQKSKVKKGIRN